MSLVIQTLRSSKDPWEIFQAVHADSPTCFFLDSPHYAPPDQVFSYIGMDPALEVRLERDTLHVRGEENGKYPVAKLFPVLERLLRKYKTHSKRTRPFFTGGFVGYFGYEAADLCDKIFLRAKPGPEVPRVLLGLFRNVIVYDHRKRIYHVVINARGARHGARDTEKLKKFFEAAAPEGKRFKLKQFTAEMTKNRFKAMVSKAREYIAAGDIYQLLN